MAAATAERVGYWAARGTASDLDTAQAAAHLGLDEDAALVGLVLTSSAVLVVLAGAWRAGALYLPRPAAPARATAPGRRLSARERADGERSARLLRAIFVVAGARTGGVGGLSEFERIVLHGVAALPGRQYPPAGHGYPRP